MVDTLAEALSLDFTNPDTMYIIKVRPLLEAFEAKFGAPITQMQLKDVTGISQPALSGWVNGYYKRLDLTVAIRVVKYFDAVLDEEITLSSIIEEREVIKKS